MNTTLSNDLGQPYSKGWQIRLFLSLKQLIVFFKTAFVFASPYLFLWLDFLCFC